MTISVMQKLIKFYKLPLTQFTYSHSQIFKEFLIVPTDCLSGQVNMLIHEFPRIFIKFNEECWQCWQNFRFIPFDLCQYLVSAGYRRHTCYISVSEYTGPGVVGTIIVAAVVVEVVVLIARVLVILVVMVSGVITQWSINGSTQLLASIVSLLGSLPV